MNTQKHVSKNEFPLSTIKVSFFLSIFIMAALACNLPFLAAEGEAMATQVAQTLTAEAGDGQVTEASVSDSPTSTPITPSPSPTSSPSPTPSPTPTPGKPDLVIESVSVGKSRIMRGERPFTTVDFRIKNQGSGPVQAGNIDIRIWDNGSLKTGTLTVSGPLDPGNTVSDAFAVGNDKAWSLGSHSLYLEVDRQDKIAESNENNNHSRTLNFNIVAGNLPDLVVTDISIPKEEILWGAEPWTWVTYTVKNQGNAKVTDSTVYLKVWDNGAETSGWTSVAGPIPVGGTRTDKFAVGHDNAWSYGMHTVKVEVDYRENINELKEDNNFSSTVDFEVLIP